MNHIHLSIAGFSIDLHLHKTEYTQSQAHFLSMLQTYYGGFIQHARIDKADFTIQVIQENKVMVIKNKNRNFIEFYRNTPNPRIITTFYVISLEQFAQLLKYILYELLPKSGFFLHSAAVVTTNQKALLLIGRSGAGKSTMLSMLKDTTTPFVDDICIVRRMHNTYMCYQTPFLDKQSWIIKQSQGYVIDSIFFLQKSNETYIEQSHIEGIKIQLISELVSNTQTVTLFTTNLLRFLKIKVRTYLFHFEKEKKKVLAAMMFITKITSTTASRGAVGARSK